MQYAMPLLAVMTVGLAPVPPYRPKANDASELKKMRGTWVVATRMGGGGGPSSLGSAVTAVIVGDRLQFGRGGQVSSESTIKLGTTATPKTCDLVRVKGGSPDFTRPVKAIYKMEGDSIIMRYHATRPFDDRPEDFGSNSTDIVELTFTRMKP